MIETNRLDYKKDLEEALKNCNFLEAQLCQQKKAAQKAANKAQKCCSQTAKSERKCCL